MTRPSLVFSNTKFKNWMLMLIPYMVYCIPLVFPFPKTIGKSIRQGMGIEILIAFVLLLFGFLLKSKNKWIPKSVLFLLFGIGLSALWANPLSEWQVAGGNLFFSDSSQYFTDALRLVNGFQYSSFSARHPFATMFLSSMFWLTDSNYKLTYFIITMMASASTWMAIEEIWKKWGGLSASIFAILSFMFFRRFIGIPDCENLGYIFACLSLTIILKSFYKNGRWLFLFGIFILCVGLLTRPGAFFVIPMILIWWLWDKINHKQNVFLPVLLGTLSILCIFFLAFISNKIAGTQDGKLYSNFSYTLYGITNGGKGWEFFQKTHSMEDYETEFEAEKTALVESITTLKKDPTLSLNGVLNGYYEFFSLNPGSAFGFLGFDLYNDPAFGNEHYQQVIGLITRFIMMVLAAFGLFLIFKNRHEPLSGFLLTFVFGLFLSISFLPPRDAGMMRVYIVTMPYLFILTAIGFGKIIQIDRYLLNPQGKSTPLPPTILCIILLLLIISSLLINIFTPRVDFSEVISCPQKNQTGIISQLSKGSYINLIEDEKSQRSNIQVTRISDFENSYSFFPHREIVLPLDSIKPNSIIFNSIDQSTGNQIWISIPSSYKKFDGKTIIICGKMSSEFESVGIGFLIGEDVKLLE